MQQTSPAANEDDEVVILSCEDNVEVCLAQDVASRCASASTPVPTQNPSAHDPGPSVQMDDTAQPVAEPSSVATKKAKHPYRQR